jgi:hypothetical protein
LPYAWEKSWKNESSGWQKRKEAIAARWCGTYVPGEYGIDAVAIHDAADFDEEFFESISRDKTYLLFKADIDGRRGSPVPTLDQGSLF